jgi:hypothetical protein
MIFSSDSIQAIRDDMKALLQLHDNHCKLLIESGGKRNLGGVNTQLDD